LDAVIKIQNRTYAGNAIVLSFLSQLFQTMVCCKERYIIIYNYGEGPQESPKTIY